MAKAAASPIPRGNRLLARLPRSDRERLVAQLTPVMLELDQVLHKARVPITDAYFPIWGVTSFLTVMENGSAIEVGTVGNEGMVGVGGVLGAPSSTNQVIVQVRGEGLRISARALEKEVGRSDPLRRLLQTYQVAFHSQVSQSVACNGLHSVGKRCCRWLLMTHDRVGNPNLHLTHEYLAMMIGVRRASVTDVLGPLRDKGLIAYTRGSITILNRKGLEAASCECYRICVAEYDRLLN